MSLCFTNVLFDKAVRSVDKFGWERASGQLFQISAIVFAACAASLILIARSRGSVARTPGDALVAILVVLGTLPPVGILSRVALSGFSFYMLCVSPRGSPLWRGAAIAASTSTYFIIGPGLLRAFAHEISVADAWLVAQATGGQQLGDLVKMTGDAGWLKIFRGCSSLHAISLSIILPIAYSQWFGLSDWSRIAAVCFMTALATVMFNVARLSAMCLWPAYFDFLHLGWGSVVISQATLIAMLLICIRGFWLP